jgi:hypothetical protein
VPERQGRYDEYLNLARAEGHVARYTTMLVHRGLGEAATEYGLAYLESTEDALTLAKTLYEAEDRENALRIAECGLALDGRRAQRTAPTTKRGCACVLPCREGRSCRLRARYQLPSQSSPSAVGTRAYHSG